MHGIYHIIRSDLSKMMHHIDGESHRPGRIEVVCGSMFSGKTEELIRRMKRAKFAKQKVEIFKPAIDTRYSDNDVVSHDQNAIPSTPVETSSSILLLSSDIEVVGIDEAQFLDMGRSTSAMNWQIVVCVSSSLVWTWTSAVFLLAQCLPCVPLPTTSQRFMPSACAVATWPI